MKIVIVRKRDGRTDSLKRSRDAGKVYDEINAKLRCRVFFLAEEKSSDSRMAKMMPFHVKKI